jgi:LPXTG-site transpeptidase (sortase) family protein
MQFHDHARTMRRRFILIFAGSFIIIFSLFNVRYLYANVQYWLAPGTIENTTTSTPSPLPLARDIEFKPLPSQAQLIIDSIGINAPVVFNVPSDNDRIYTALEDGVVHYTDSVKPGMSGVSVLLGHSSAYPWYKGQFGSVFALLGKLKEGDRFYIRYSDGRFFVFEVKNSLVFNPLSNDERLEELENTTGTSIILVSCYPVGTNYQRIAIKADLIAR